MQPVESSAVARIGYDAEASEAYVEFHESGTYVYSAVPPRVFEAFQHAVSKGKFVNYVLKRWYSSYRL
jgi:hypothetical protein